MTDTAPKPVPPADPLQKTADQLNKVGVIVSSLIALSSTLFACSADSIKRNDAFLAAVISQEKQWQELYDQYFAALAAHQSDEKKQLLDDRLLAICHFSNREIPEFKEHALGLFWMPVDVGGNTAKKIDDDVCEKTINKTRQLTATCQLRNLKKGLRASLASNGVGTLASSACIKQQEAQVKANDTEKRVRNEAIPGQNIPPPITPNQKAVTLAAQANSEKIEGDSVMDAPIRRALTLETGASNGYDIDIFWCEGPNDAEIWRRAKPLADTVAAASKARNRLGNRFPIGRVRLRPLAAETQVRDDYPSSGFEVRGESSELAVGKALAASLNQLEIGTFTFRYTKNQTNWYLSAFICS